MFAVETAELARNLGQATSVAAVQQVLTDYIKVQNLPPFKKDAGGFLIPNSLESMAKQRFVDALQSIVNTPTACELLLVKPDAIQQMVADKPIKKATSKMAFANMVCTEELEPPVKRKESSGELTAPTSTAVPHCVSYNNKKPRVNTTFNNTLGEKPLATPAKTMGLGELGGLRGKAFVVK